MIVPLQRHSSGMMAVIECKKCGAEVDPEAKACPKCGAPVSPRPDRLTLIVLAVLLGLGVVLLFVPEPTRDTDSVSMPDTTAAPDMLAVAREACRAALERSFEETVAAQLESEASWLSMAEDDGTIEVFPRGRVRDADGASMDREWLCAFKMEGGSPQLVSLTQVPR